MRACLVIPKYRRNCGGTIERREETIREFNNHRYRDGESSTCIRNIRWESDE